MSLSLLGAALLLASAAVEPVQGTCSSYPVTVSQVSGTAYNPADPQAVRLTLELRATQTNLPASCANVRVLLARVIDDPRPFRFRNGINTLDGSYAGDTDLEQQTNNRFALTAAARQQLVSGQTVRIDYVDFAPGQYERPGDYASAARLQVGDDASDLPLGIRVEPAIILIGSSADGQESIDLGDLSRGARGSTRIFYRTNADLQVTATSDNQGALVHENGPSFGRIPYTAEFAGRTLNLSNPSQINLQLSRSVVQSERLDVTVPPTPDMYAGLYRDVLTLSFVPY
jgi:hypothetical protein